MSKTQTRKTVIASCSVICHCKDWLKTQTYEAVIASRGHSARFDDAAISRTLDCFGNAWNDASQRPYEVTK